MLNHHWVSTCDKCYNAAHVINSYWADVVSAGAFNNEHISPCKCWLLKYWRTPKWISKNGAIQKQYRILHYNVLDYIFDFDFSLNRAIIMVSYIHSKMLSPLWPQLVTLVVEFVLSCGNGKYLWTAIFICYHARGSKDLIGHIKRYFLNNNNNLPNECLEVR